MLAGGKEEASSEGHGQYDGTWNWRGHDGWGVVVIFSSRLQQLQ